MKHGIIAGTGVFVKRYFAVFILVWPSLAQQGDWPVYGGDAGGTRFSKLAQINRDNVKNLSVAWTYRTGALTPETDLNSKAAFEATPILVDGLLYLSTPFDQVIALDPASGTLRWHYDPKVSRTDNYSEVTSRGVSAWLDSRASSPSPCRSRIFIGTIDARLIALDAKTGELCKNFGGAGQVDLTRGVHLRDRGDYQVTSPPAIVRDLVIVGSSIGDNRAVAVESGIVRAFDARTGKLRWSWNPIPWAEKQKPRTGAANAWSIFSVDSERDLIFIPTGSASPDFYGGKRRGSNLYASSVVALRASTGSLVWGFQVAHHDLWDYDVASQPVLINYRDTPAVAVTTKIGHLFVLDRVTGKPLHPVEERRVPQTDVPGEETWPTQPVPSFPALAPQRLTADEAWGTTSEEQAWCREKIRSLRNEGLFTPPSLGGSLQYPGNGGGVNWGGAAVDSERGLLFVNTNRIPFLIKLIPRDKLQTERAGVKQDRFRGEFGEQAGTPYAMYRHPLRSPGGVLCNAPPWGVLTAFDLNAGKARWETPLGTMVPGQATGSPNLGGPIATAGGLVFTAAARDNYLRAFDSDTGQELWKAQLPAGAQSTPMTYSIGGKQYVVICAGGHGKLGTKLGDYVLAFALP